MQYTISIGSALLGKYRIALREVLARAKYRI